MNFYVSISSKNSWSIDTDNPHPHELCETHFIDLEKIVMTYRHNWKAMTRALQDFFWSTLLLEEIFMLRPGDLWQILLVAQAVTHAQIVSASFKSSRL